MPGRLDVQIPTADGHSPGTLHVPDGDGRWPGVLVFPDAGGVRETFGQLGDHLAGLGYVVLSNELLANLRSDQGTGLLRRRAAVAGRRRRIAW